MRLEPGQRRPPAAVPRRPPAGACARSAPPQTLLGVVDHVAYAAESHVLGRDDLLVAVTDGVLERRDGTRMLGEEGRSPTSCAGTRQLPAQAVAERIRRLVAEFTDAPQHDDMAVLAIRMEMGAGTTGARPSAEA